MFYNMVLTNYIPINIFSILKNISPSFFVNLLFDLVVKNPHLQHESFRSHQPHLHHLPPAPRRVDFRYTVSLLPDSDPSQAAPVPPSPAGLVMFAGLTFGGKMRRKYIPIVSNVCFILMSVSWCIYLIYFISYK